MDIDSEIKWLEHLLEEYEAIRQIDMKLWEEQKDKVEYLRRQMIPQDEALMRFEEGSLGNLTFQVNYVNGMIKAVEKQLSKLREVR